MHLFKLAVVGFEIIVMKNHNDLLPTIHLTGFSAHNSAIWESVIRLEVRKSGLDES